MLRHVLKAMVWESTESWCSLLKSSAYDTSTTSSSSYLFHGVSSACIGKSSSWSNKFSFNEFWLIHLSWKINNLGYSSEDNSCWQKEVHFPWGVRETPSFTGIFYFFTLSKLFSLLIRCSAKKLLEQTYTQFKNGFTFYCRSNLNPYLSTILS